jgi:hypothetical protein
MTAAPRPRRPRSGSPGATESPLRRLRLRETGSRRMFRRDARSGTLPLAATWMKTGRPYTGGHRATLRSKGYASSSGGKCSPEG